MNIDWGNPYRRLAEGELLARIGTGDQRAENHLMAAYLPALLIYTKRMLYDQPQQLGEPGDYAHDALLTLVFKARQAGADALKDQNRPISGWLKRTASFQLQNAIRKDRFDRDDWPDNDEDDEQPQLIADTLADESADMLATMTETDRDQLIRKVLATQPAELQTLVRLKFTVGLLWEEISEQMMQLYPAHTTPFSVDYLQKTYWPKTVGKRFREKLIDLIKRYGYDC